jgi:hypothetical protein
MKYSCSGGDCSVKCYGRENDMCVDLVVDGEAARSLSVEFAIAGGQIMTDSRQRYWGAHIGTAGAKGAAIRCPGTESGGPCSIKCVGSENSGAPGRFGHMYQRTGVPSQLCHSMTVNASRSGPAPVVSVACIGRGPEWISRTTTALQIRPQEAVFPGLRDPGSMFADADSKSLTGC